MRERDPDFDLWVAEARAGAFALAMQLCGFAPAKGKDKGNDIAGPCPACGGRFTTVERIRGFERGQGRAAGGQG